jgi:hypothetical protein
LQKQQTMNTTGYTRNLINFAAQNPDAWNASLVAKYGFNERDSETLLRLVGKLQQPDTPRLSASDTATLCRLHPHVAQGEIESMVGAINKSPGHVRAGLLTACLAADVPAMMGNAHLRSDAAREVQRLADEVQKLDYSHAINSRRDGGRIKDEPEPRHVEGPLSTREIIKQQMEPKGVRPAYAELEREGLQGGPVTDLVRGAMADRLEEAYSTLDVDSPASLHDTLTAAANASEIEATAVDRGWIDARQE